MARIDPFLFIPTASIGTQCQEDYFYRDDGNLDELLKDFEDDVAPVLIRVARNESFDSKEESALRLLAVTLNNRTRKAVEYGKQFPKRIAFEVINRGIDKGDLPPPPKDWSEDMVDFTGVAGTLMSATIPCWMEMKTLDCKLLKAEPGSYFITSDNPVILLNQYFQSELPYRSYIGFGRSGFQLMLPISPTICLLFYDPKVYKVGTRSSQTTQISAWDVETVNSLQVQSAERCLYCHDPSQETVIRSLLVGFAKHRTSVRSSLRTLKNASGKDEILHFVGPTIRVTRPWSVCCRRRHVTIGRDRRRDPMWSHTIDLLSEDIEMNPRGGELFERLERILECKLKS